MTKQEIDELVIRLITLGYYWVGDDNYSCSLNLVHHLRTVNCSQVAKDKVGNFYDDWVTIFSQKYKESEIELFEIPENYNSDDEKRLLWIATQGIMNLLNSTDFEMGYLLLMELTEDYPLIYANIIHIIKNSDIKLPLSEWLVAHMLMARDINGDEDIEFAGYKITKL